MHKVSFDRLEQIVAHRFFLFFSPSGCHLQRDMDECIIFRTVRNK